MWSDLGSYGKSELRVLTGISVCRHSTVMPPEIIEMPFDCAGQHCFLDCALVVVYSAHFQTWWSLFVAGMVLAQVRGLLQIFGLVAEWFTGWLRGQPLRGQLSHLLGPAPRQVQCLEGKCQAVLV